MADGGHLPSSYDRWRVGAVDLEERVRANGREAVRTVIEPKAFRRWCAAHRLAANAQARLVFIEECLRADR
jgi:hypothetical protein